MKTIIYHIKIGSGILNTAIDIPAISINKNMSRFLLGFLFFLQTIKINAVMNGNNVNSHPFSDGSEYGTKIIIMFVTQNNKMTVPCIIDEEFTIV
jgi:hypothetical protein